MQKINKKYTFDNFIVSKNNQNTIEILKDMNTSANLFYIVGDIGVGKTHLVQAIGNQLKDKNIIYATVEGFMNNFTNALRNSSLQEFREEYRQCDMLIIEDFHFIGGKEATQEEFLHTIKELLINDKKVIITSDKKVSDLNGVEARIKDYLLGGLVLELNYLDDEAKVKLIKIKLEDLKLTLDDKSIKSMASANKTVRAIDGALYQLEASLNLNKI